MTKRKDLLNAAFNPGVPSTAVPLLRNVSRQGLLELWD